MSEVAAPRPRLRLWYLLTIGPMIAALALIVIVNLGNFANLKFVFNLIRHEEDPWATFLLYFSLDSGDVVPEILQVWLAAWTIPALIKLMLLVGRPARWDSFRRFSWFLFCTITVAGYPLGAMICGATGLLPDSWWLTLLLILIAPLTLPPLGLLTLFGLTTSIGIVTGVVLFLAIGLPIMVVDYLNERGVALHIRRQKQAWLLQYLARFRMWLSGEPLPDPAPDDSRGARFATLAEVAQLHAPDAPEAMAFGHIGDTPLFLKTDKHVLIMASTRSGKGVTLIMPHLLRYQGSAFILDPKGENAKGTGRHRATLNGRVHYLDPFGISGKPQSRFNPLARFTPDNMEAESKALAAALFVVGERERDHWTAAGQQLLAAIILYVFVTPDIPKASKDLPTVRHILLGGLKEALEAMVAIDAADGLLRDLAMSFIATPEKEFGSIVSTTQRQTEILDNPAMVACLSARGAGPEVDFKEWHTGTMTVYLCLSAPKFPTFNRWLRLVLTSALDEMTDTLNPPKLPVCFMLDELATLGHLAAVENAVGLAAGYGIQLVTVFQDVAQMRDLYKGRWASFIGNAGIRALFNLDDFETAEYWSKFVGGRLVETHGRQEDVYGLSNGQNVGESMRPMLPPEQLMMDFAAGRMLVLAQGAHPIITSRVAYWKDDSLAGLWDDPRIPTRKPAPQTASPAPHPPPPPSAPPPSAPPASPRPNVPVPPRPPQSQPPAAPAAAPVTVKAELKPATVAAATAKAQPSKAPPPTPQPKAAAPASSQPAKTRGDPPIITRISDGNFTIESPTRQGTPPGQAKPTWNDFVSRSKPPGSKDGAKPPPSPSQENER